MPYFPPQRRITDALLTLFCAVVCGLLLATVGGSYLIADALRDAFDPRTVRRRPDDAERASPLSIVSDEA